MSAFRSTLLVTIPILRPRTSAFGSRRVFCTRSYKTESGKVSEPLRILFCGADEFSCDSLSKLHREHLSNAELVKSIDVVVRPPKRVGRGRKRIGEGTREPLLQGDRHATVTKLFVIPAAYASAVPLKSLAESLKLPIHERDTFTGWNMPRPGGEPINLIIAVSFGLFVPRRLLRAARYGGLNVHPSLLPDLRGPAPIHHAILQGRTHTGVSLQTLSEEAFDKGVVLDQTSWPGLPLLPDAKLVDLLEQHADIGGNMLVQGLRSGVHVPPQIAVGWQPTSEQIKALSHAPKIVPADRQVRWAGKDAWGADGAIRRARAVQPLWTRALDEDGEEKRILFDGLEVVPREKWPREVKHVMRAVGQKVKAQSQVGAVVEIDDVGIAELKGVTWVQEDEIMTASGELIKTRLDVNIPCFVDGDSIVIPTAKGDCLRIHGMTVEGEKPKPAAVAIKPFAGDIGGYGGPTSYMDSMVDGLTLGGFRPLSWLEDSLQ